MEVGPTKVAAPVPPKPAWGTPILPAPVVSLAEVMSEELANHLQHKEQEDAVWEVLAEPEVKEDAVEPLLLTETGDCANDHLIAQVLQAQFDREYDSDLRRKEQKVNREAKVSISLSNYRRMPDTYKYDSDSDPEDDTDDMERDWDTFETSKKAFPVIPKCGYKKHGDTMVTKHDITMSNRRNACRVMEFPPGIETGDGGRFDMQLSNKVFNSLKVYSHVEADRHTRVHDKVEKSTSVLALDPKTRLLLFKMVDKHLLENINGIVSTGKEALIIHADGGNSEDKLSQDEDEKDENASAKGASNPQDSIKKGRPVPAECAIKVYKTTLSEFKNRDRYIQDDYRFKERFSKQNPRKVIHMWAEKEMHNLIRMQRAEIPCPDVVQLKKHILVMSFIGTDRQPAPKLKEAAMSFSDFCLAYDQTVEVMKKLYEECQLVHADLSEYNILWHEHKCWFIDVSQSVDKTHPHALEFLYRDCTNISNFFNKKGVPDVKSPAELFYDVCGLIVTGGDVEALAQIQDYEENEELLTHGKTEKEFPFESTWEELQKGGGGKFASRVGKPLRKRNKSNSKDKEDDHHKDNGTNK